MLHWQGWTGTMNPTPANNKNSGVKGSNNNNKKEEQ
jgi:hypothetical protein